MRGGIQYSRRRMQMGLLLQSEFNGFNQPCFLTKSSDDESTSKWKRKCCIPGGGGRKWTVCPRIGSKSIHSGRLSDRGYEDCCRSTASAGGASSVNSVNSVNLVGDNGSRVADQWFNGCRRGFLGSSILFTIIGIPRRIIHIEGHRLQG